MQIRQPRTGDLREMERWMDEVSKQLNELPREGAQRHIIIPGQDGEEGEDGSFADDDHTQYQKKSEKDNPDGYAGLDASARTVKGVDTTDDVIVNSSAKGLVLKDTQGTPHYWRVSVSVLGVLSTADLGVSKP